MRFNEEVVSIIRCLSLLLQEVTSSPKHFTAVTSATKELLEEYKGLIKQGPAVREPCKLQLAPAPLAIALLPYNHKARAHEDQL